MTGVGGPDVPPPARGTRWFLRKTGSLRTLMLMAKVRSYRCSRKATEAGSADLPGAPLAPQCSRSSQSTRQQTHISPCNFNTLNFKLWQREAFSPIATRSVCRSPDSVVSPEMLHCARASTIRGHGQGSRQGSPSFSQTATATTRFKPKSEREYHGSSPLLSAAGQGQYLSEDRSVRGTEPIGHRIAASVNGCLH